MVNAVEKSGMRSGLICRSGAIAGRMACVLAAALLTCAFSAHAQVIEEGGFPVKGGDNSGEPFSLSCPSRLVVQAASSIVLSCSATAVPEEGIRYEWESISVGGLDFLSAPDELPPLFMAPSSGAGEKYAYRLTAMSVGVYETADVTVSVEGFPEDDTRGEGSAGPGVCDTFAFEGYREGCFSKGEGSELFSPFGGDFENPAGSDPFFPGSPGAPGKDVPGSGGYSGPGMATAPYLDCPPAVFLQELEIGSIECHVSDAVGEEFLEYMWEPVGSTTRDYLDNPRLTPEDSPYPSVVAPEAPRYETLESFRSGETTFRYRYRLTATSRATGLSSSSEVEVFVSSSRPSVYCPLEVVVEEGETAQLDCEGVDPLSSRMDYDEEVASIEWEWESLWGTSMSLLDATDLSSPLFTAPAGSAGKEYHYIASMTSSASGESRTARRRVTVTVTGGEEGEQAAADSDALAGTGSAPVVTCEDPDPVYEGADDIELDCSVIDKPADPRYAWTIRGSTSDTDDLINTDSLRATFSVPDNVNADTDYEYTVTLSAAGIDDVTEDVTVTVLNKPAITVTCEEPDDVDEGASIGLECEASGAPTGSTYTWSWSPTMYLTNHDTAMPTFSAPADVDRDTTYTYTVTASAENAEDGTAEVTVTVKDAPVPVVTCEDAEVYEGEDDFALDCEVENEPSGATYSWSGSGSTTDTSLLASGTDSLTPTFAVPDDYDPHNWYDVFRDYQYTVALSVGGRVVLTENVIITVKDKNISCWRNSTQLTSGEYSGTDEGGRSVKMYTCQKITGAGPFSYSWASDLDSEFQYLSNANKYVPTFTPPDNVSSSMGFFYSLTISSPNAPSILIRGGVWVYNATLKCRNIAVYEGSADFDLDCSMRTFPVPGPSRPFNGPDYSYTWSARGDTPDTSLLIADTDGFTPTFAVPDNVDADTDYEYKLTVFGTRGALLHEANVTVTVLKKPDIVIDCPGDPYSEYEGEDHIVLDCEATGAPSGSTYNYTWTAGGVTQDTDKLRRKGTAKPRFDVPNEVNSDETYEYTLTVSAENAITATEDVTVRVLKKPDIVIDCPGDPYSKYEGEDDIVLDCEATGAPSDSEYDYVWTGRGSTPNTNKLAGTDGPTPTFEVPGEVDSDETYEYTLTVSAENAITATEDVTVRVLNKVSLALVCTAPVPVYEGSPDFDLNCSASGAPSGSGYDYVWTARGATSNTDLLITGTDGSTPTFDVPDEVTADTDYEYTLTVSARGADPETANVTVTVLNKKALDVACATPSPVYEGSKDFALDCVASGAPAGFEIVYVWTARGSTANTDLLVSGTDGPTPAFDMPEEVDEDETYEYLLTVSAENAIDAAAEVTVTVLNLGSIALICASSPLVYEGSEDFALDCSVSGDTGNTDYTYEWTVRGETPNTAQLSATDTPSPTFYVPDALEETTMYEYLLTASAETVEDATAEVTVTVLNRGTLAVACAPSPLVYEGSADFALDCTASGAPSSSDYAYVWTARGDTQDTSLLSAVDIASPTFLVPDEVASTTTYEYLLTASAANAEDGLAQVTVTVLNQGALRVVCADPPSVYEGSADFALDCIASGAPSSSDYAYVWTARGDTQDTSLLSAVDIASPAFLVPDEVTSTTTYEYLLTASAENAEDGSAQVTVTVLNQGALRVVCADPPSVYEGSADFDLDCSASGVPAGSDYAYVWTARGDTQDVSLLSATDIESPIFYVPDEVIVTTTYEYLLTASAENAESGSAQVTVTVLNRGVLAVACTDPDSVYEGSEDFALDCSASGAPAGSEYAYAWTARGSTANTALLIADTDGPTPTFAVPDALDATTTYEYLLTVSATNAESASAEVTVTVLNRGVLAVVCTDPDSVYEGSEDFALDCSASGAPAGSEYAYAWTARGSTANTALLIADTDGPTPTFAVPDALDATTTYEYLLTVSATNAESASAEVTVTVLNRGVLAVVCTDPDSVYEGSEDFALDCSASGAPAGSEYAYAWTARGSTANTALLIADTDGPTPTFAVPDALDATTTYEYLLTVSATNAESASAEVTVTVLNRPPGPTTDFSPPIAETPREIAEPSSLGVTVSASPLRFGVQSAETQVSLDPMTDGISTRVSGPYHAGRMTLSPGGGEALDENGEMDLSIELASPVMLRREGGIEAASIVLAPQWSFAESCEQLSSQAIGSLYTEVTLSDADCRLLRFGGDLDLTGVLSGQYTGSLDLILRSGESEETHSVEVEVTVVPAQRVITIGPGGVRFSMSRELPAGLTEEQNLSIYPHIAFLTEEKPNGVFELSNPSLISLEITVSARFGYTEATENGREVVVEDSSGSHLGDLSKVVDIRPGVLVLMPGEKGLVRYGVQEGALAAMADKGYAAFFDLVSEPRQYVRSDRMPEEVSGGRTARVTMRVPGVYVPDEGASQLRATLLSISYVGPMSATFLLETQDHPFAGEVLAYDGEGRELGRRETLVYTRSRVRIPLDRMPEEGTVFLRFAPRGSGRVPEPASVEWDAPRRDIGAAEDKDRATTTETLAREP